MDLTKLFCDVDDFLKINSSSLPKKLQSGKRAYAPRKCQLTAAEVMTICIAFHQSGYRNFKQFYLSYVFILCI